MRKMVKEKTGEWEFAEDLLARLETLKPAVRDPWSAPRQAPQRVAPLRSEARGKSAGIRATWSRYVQGAFLATSALAITLAFFLLAIRWFAWRDFQLNRDYDALGRRVAGVLSIRSEKGVEWTPFFMNAYHEWLRRENLPQKDANFERFATDPVLVKDMMRELNPDALDELRREQSTASPISTAPGRQEVRSEARQSLSPEDEALKEAALKSKDAAFALMERIQQIDGMIAQLALEPGARESILLLEVEKSFLTGNPLSASMMKSLREVERESIQRMLFGIEGELIGAGSRLKQLNQSHQEAEARFKAMGEGTDTSVRKNVERRIQNLRRQIETLSQNVGQLEVLLEEYRGMLVSQPEARAETRSAVEARQELQERVLPLLSPKGLDWYEKTKPAFGTALMADVVWGISVRAEGISPEDAQRVAGIMEAYFLAKQSGKFNLAIFVENAQSYIVGHPLFAVSETPAKMIEDLTEMPSDERLVELVLQLRMNPKQDMVWIIKKRGSLARGVVQTKFDAIVKALGATADVNARLDIQEAANVVQAIQTEASKTVEAGLVPTVLVKNEKMRQDLLALEGLNGNVLFAETNINLAAVQRAASIRFSQQSAKVKITAEIWKDIEAELTKKLEGAVKLDAKGRLMLDNAALTALAAVLSELVAIQATSVAA